MDESIGSEEITLGSEKYAAKDEYPHTITNLFMKVNNAADSQSLSNLQWTLNYYTDVLISAILDRETREAMADAKEAIFQSELMKMKLKDKDTEEGEKQAKVIACTKIIGEIRTYFDKYMGLEQKLAALV